MNVDKLTYAGNVENLREVESSNRYFFEKADICNRAKLDQIFSYLWLLQQNQRTIDDR